MMVEVVGARDVGEVAGVIRAEKKKTVRIAFEI